MKHKSYRYRLWVSLCLCVFALLISILSCSKPLVTAKASTDIAFVSKSFATNKEEAYAAIRFGLKANGYAIADEDQKEGVARSTWVSTTSDSHYVELFQRKDFGAIGAYHQLEAHVIPENGKIRIDIGSRVKTVAKDVHSTGIEERKVLSKVANYLRTSEPKITNIGVE